jgi:CTP:molybdopterin cytidylyltransferase MocA
MQRGQATTAALILAAGDSLRMGIPKALLHTPGDRTFVAALVDALRTAGCAPIVVVVGRHASHIRAESGATPDRYVVNPDPDRGQLGSVQHGLHALPGATTLLIAPVDQGPVCAGTLAALLAAPPCPWLVPAFDGTPGHPIRIAADAVQALRRAPHGAASLRDVLTRACAHPRLLPTRDPAVLRNVNTPADYAAYSHTDPRGPQ